MKTEKEINKNVNGYYVPKLEDFKPGFKFETALYRKGDLNYKENIAEEDKWVEKEVVWIKQPDGSYTSPGVIGITDERMSSGELNVPTFRKAQRLKRELNLNINTKPAITYMHCCAYVAV
jgi:hypothetical protein